MNIEIHIKNVGRGFSPHPQALSKLLKVVERLYKNPVEFSFEIAIQYKLEADGRIVPILPVEITVSECTPNRRRLPSGDYSAQADTINQKIQDLLVFSNVEDFNLPATTTISAGGKTYKFVGSEATEEQEWR